MTGIVGCRARRERPRRRRAAKKRDELAAFHYTVSTVLPDRKDSTALLRCGISIWLMSLVGQNRSLR